MTNFFGSVMETIHTDSAYKALSRTSSSRAEIKMPFDRSINDNERRVLADSDRQDHISDLKNEVPLLYSRYDYLEPSVLAFF